MARIMVADDSDAIRMVLKDALEIGHHEVVAEATNGIEAVEEYNEVNPDVLLLDIAMPKKDGASALKDIMSTHTDAKVIMITASDNLKTINECVSIGALAYIMKPFDFDDVLKAIAMALDKR